MSMGRIISCSKLRCCLYTLVVVILVIIVFIFYKSKRHSCSPNDGEQMIAELCHQYNDKKITGDLCIDLCNLQTIHLKSCLAGGANKHVLLVKWKDSLMVLKSRIRDPSDLQPLTIWNYKNDQSPVSDSPDVDFFEHMIYNEAKALLSITLPENKTQLMSILTNGQYNPKLSKPSLSFMNTLMNLVKQEEYVNFKYYRDFHRFPTVIGYCGHFYGVEFLPPDRMLTSMSLKSYRNMQQQVGWESRVTISLHLIDLINSMDVKIDDGIETTHMCDMKAENFGVGDDLTVKIIDGDMIFSPFKMGSILAAEECSQDSDCDFFDCEGICDVTRKVCSDQRKNFNYQVLCRDIFSTGFRGTQLLSNPPAGFRDAINEEIIRCSQLDRVDLRTHAPRWDPSLKLRKLLVQSCQSDT